MQTDVNIWWNHLSGDIYIQFGIHDNQLWKITREFCKLPDEYLIDAFKALKNGTPYAINGKTLTVSDEYTIELGICMTEFK